MKTAPGQTARAVEPVSDVADQQGVRSVQRALDILSLLTVDRPTVSIRDIVESTGLAKTTVIRLVATLEQSGFYVQVRTETSTQPPGTIIYQMPSGGVPDFQTNTVTVTVAKAPPPAG